jgi:hypothetical protein
LRVLKFQDRFHYRSKTNVTLLSGVRVIGPEGGAEDGADGAGVGEGAAGVDVLVVSSSLSVMDIKEKFMK